MCDREEYAKRLTRDQAVEDFRKQKQQKAMEVRHLHSTHNHTVTHTLLFRINTAAYRPYMNFRKQKQQKALEVPPPPLHIYMIAHTFGINTAAYRPAFTPLVF
jgi:hypothetical protein